ncbi:MAG: hypothetical protein PHO65_04360 [Sulfurovum sp.]|nr:hypothetical protein [Sulfurovum sp.]
MYDLPYEWESFYIEMCDRAKTYIKIKYWDITEEDLLLWLSNFNTDHEKFFSAIIIYRLIYRNEQPRLSMYHHIIEVILPEILTKHHIYDVVSLEKFYDDLKRNFHNIPFRFSTVEGVDQQASKSGHEILRSFARKGSFHNNLKISVNSLHQQDPQKIKAIVLFDDIMATGEQFNTFLQKYNSVLSNFLIIYCPLTAYIDAISYIEREHPNVIVSPVEVLNAKYCFFNKSFMPKIAENIDMDELKRFYISLTRTKTHLRQDLLGKGKLSLTYIFDVSSPNNSLPILSYEDSNWKKLFPR